SVQHPSLGSRSRSCAIAASARRCQAAGEKLTAVAQSVLIDAVADAVGHVPFDRDAERGEPARSVEQRLRRGGVPAVAPAAETRSTGGRDLISAANFSGLTSGGTASNPE